MTNSTSNFCGRGINKCSINLSKCRKDNYNSHIDSKSILELSPATAQKPVVWTSGLMSLDLLDLENISTGIGRNLLFDEGSLARVGAVEDVVDFLHSG